MKFQGLSIEQIFPNYLPCCQPGLTLLCSMQTLRVPQNTLEFPCFPSPIYINYVFSPQSISTDLRNLTLDSVLAKSTQLLKPQGRHYQTNWPSAISSDNVRGTEPRQTQLEQEEGDGGAWLQKGHYRRAHSLAVLKAVSYDKTLESFLYTFQAEKEGSTE